MVGTRFGLAKSENEPIKRGQLRTCSKEASKIDVTIVGGLLSACDVGEN